MKKMLYFIIIVSFLDTFVQLPIITPYAIGMGATYTFAGIIVAVYSLTNMLGNIIGGHWIDQFGRKRILIYGMFSITFILLLYPVVQTGEALLVIRVLHGLAGGVLIPAAFAYVGDVTSTGNRAKPMAYTGAAIGGAAIIGPAIGGVMAARSKIEYVFIFVAILFSISVYLVIRYIPESFKQKERSRMNIREFVPLLKSKTLMQASLAAFALMISNGTLAFALPLKVAELGLKSDTTGILLSVFGIMALIVFLTKLNRIFSLFNPLSLILNGLVLVGISLFTLHFIQAQWQGFLIMAVYGLGFALIFPSMNQMVADAVKQHDRGKAYGIFYAFFSLGVVAGSSISGFISDRYGIPFIISACIMLACSGVLLQMNQMKKPIQ